MEKMYTTNEGSRPANFKGDRMKLAVRVPLDTRARLEYLQAEWGIDTQGDVVDAALRFLELQTRHGLSHLAGCQQADVPEIEQTIADPLPPFTGAGESSSR